MTQKTEPLREEKKNASLAPNKWGKRKKKDKHQKWYPEPEIDIKKKGKPGKKKHKKKLDWGEEKGQRPQRKREVGALFGDYQKKMVRGKGRGRGAGQRLSWKPGENKLG